MALSLGGHGKAQFAVEAHYLISRFHSVADHRSSHDTSKTVKIIEGKTMKNRQFDLSFFSPKVEKRTSTIDGAASSQNKPSR